LASLERLVECQLADQYARQLTATREPGWSDSAEKRSVIFANGCLKQGEVADDNVIFINPDVRC
jgi:hypothetical protein